MIEVRNLTKCYGKKFAISNLNFKVNEGEIVGYLGPNGAGKSTTMNIITGYIAPTLGDVFIGNNSITEEPSKTKSNIGYLPEQPPLYPTLTVMEYLNFVCEIKKSSKNDLQSIIEKFKIDTVINKLICNLSKGYKQRVGLAQAFIGNPSALILDEPMTGLDPAQTVEVRDIIKSYKEGHAILLSSHVLSEVDVMADRIIIISNGGIVADDTSANLSRSFAASKKIVVRIRGNDNHLESIKHEFKCLDIKKGIEPNCLDLVLENNTDDDAREKFFDIAKNIGVKILMMKPFGFSLEDVFMQITQDNHNDSINTNLFEDANNTTKATYENLDLDKDDDTNNTEVENKKNNS
jgi:ABC-2 type transport system ATP-binding protein